MLVLFHFFRAILAGAILGSIFLGVGGQLAMTGVGLFYDIPVFLLDANILNVLEFGSVCGVLGGGLYLVNRTLIRPMGLSGLFAGLTLLALVVMGVMTLSEQPELVRADTLMTAVAVSALYGWVLESLLRSFEEADNIYSSRERYNPHITW